MDAEAAPYIANKKKIPILRNIVSIIKGHSLFINEISYRRTCRSNYTRPCEPVGRSLSVRRVRCRYYALFDPRATDYEQGEEYRIARST